ncbi:MAG: flippase-like domain-containing protein [Methanotrichaceae archaeon]|nr:flippase-like domain-containing protein [Methanotrichaceae archaeon]
MEPREYITTKKLTFFVLSGAIVFAALILIGNYEDMYKSLQMITPKVIVILLGLTLLNIAFRFLKWEYFLRVLDIKVPIKSSLMVFLSGIAMVITPGKIGEVFKAQLLKEKECIERRKTLVVIFAERLTDVIGLTVLSILGIWSTAINAWAIVGISFIIAALIFLMKNEKAFTFVCLHGKKVPILRDQVAYGDDVYNNCRQTLTIKNVILATIISSISWSFEGIALFFLLQNIGENVSLMASIAIFSFSSIFGAILVLPGGIGAAEGSFFTLLLLAGVPKSTASTTTIIIRITTLWFGVAIGLISLFLFDRTLKKSKVHQNDLDNEMSLLPDDPTISKPPHDLYEIKI